MGTTMGMLIADAIGIYAGVVAGKKIPERLIKLISALIFIAFGYIGLYTSVPREYLSLPYIAGLAGITALAFWCVSRGSKREPGSRPKKSRRFYFVHHS